MRTKLGLLGLLAVVSACAMSPKVGQVSPATALYAVEGNYAAALQLAVAYRQLPRCPVSAPVCHDPAVVVRLRAANQRARTALRGAETIVAARGSAAQIEAAVSLATAEIADFTATVPRS